MARNYLQGKFTPNNPSKYKGNVSNIVFRSSWERAFFLYCDGNQNVVKWSSETVIVPYRSPKDNAIHRYFIDAYVEVKIPNSDTVKKILVEIKPKAQTMEPKEPKKKTKGYINECITYAVNQAKWESARKFAELNNMEFVIMTEIELGIKR